MLAKQAITDRKLPSESTTGQDVTDAANKSVSVILNAYLEALLKLLSIDDLIQAFEKYPAVGIIIDSFKSIIKCPSKVIKDIKNLKMKEFKIDACNPSLPIMPKIPKIEMVNPFKLVRKSFTAAIREALSKVISVG